MNEFPFKLLGTVLVAGLIVYLTYEVYVLKEQVNTFNSRIEATQEEVVRAHNAFVEINLNTQLMVKYMDEFADAYSHMEYDIFAIKQAIGVDKMTPEVQQLFEEDETKDNNK